MHLFCSKQSSIKNHTRYNWPRSEELLVQTTYWHIKYTCSLLPSALYLRHTLGTC